MRFLPALLLLLFTAIPSDAVIMKLTPLAEVLESEQFILVAAVEKVDPAKPSAILTLEKSLKGKPPFERLPINMTGDDEARKQGDTKTILERLDPTRKVIIFASKRGKKLNAMAFVEGSWFSIQGTIDDADKSIRWAFLHGEPYLRRTFKGTSAELGKVIEDGLAKKARPPEPDEKAEKGYGPAMEKKCEELTGQTPTVREGVNHHPVPFGRGSPVLFGVIPSFVLVGPLAIVAALFPGVFARMAVGMKRWRAFLVVAILNSTLAILYYFTQKYLPHSRWFGIQAFTIGLMLVALVGLLWAGLRYRRLARAEPQITAVPTKVELYSLGGLTLFAALCVALTAAFSNWGTNLEVPFRELTFIGIALFVATLYACYRKLTANIDGTDGPPPERRLSLSGESVGLGILVLCGLVTVLNSGPRTGPIASGTETGDAAAIGPRLLGEPHVFTIPGATQVMSGIVARGDRLFFGTDTTRLSGRVGTLVCLDRTSGEVKWKFEADDDLLPVFCTPTVTADRVYCGEGLHTDKNCRIFCVNATDGKPAWEKPLQTSSHTEGAPAILNGQVFFPAGDDGLFAADARTGAKHWQFPGGKEKGIHIDAAPVVSGNRVFAGSGLYSFVAVCLDANSGEEKWRTDLRLRAFGAPIVIGKHIYFGVGTGNMVYDTFAYDEEGGRKEDQPAGAIVCLETETGKEAWRFDLPRSVHTGLAADPFSIYATSRDGFVYCLDRKTGKMRWKTGIGAAITAAPAVAAAGGMPIAVYAFSQEGSAVCLNPHTGAICWQKPLPGFQWDGKGENGVFGVPAIVSTTTPSGSKRSVYIGGMTVDPFNPAKKTAAIFRFDDEIGGDEM